MKNVKCFLSDPTIPFAYRYVCLMRIRCQRGMLDLRGERCSILDLFFLENGGRQIQVVILVLVY